MHGDEATSRAGIRPGDVAIAVIAGVGVWLRIIRLVLTRELPVEPDAVAFLGMARELSFLDPWQASSREPLFVAIVKAVAGPFGYSPGPLRAFSLAMGIGAVIFACVLFARLLPPVGAAVATAMVSLHKLLIYDATGGLRESLSLCLLLAVLHWTRVTRRPILAGLAAGALTGVRWELGLLCLFALLFAAVLRRDRPAIEAAAVALAAAVVVVGPFLVSNAQTYDDPFFHSSVHATWYANIEQTQNGDARVPLMTWRHYYIDFVGIDESVERGALGAVEIPTGIAAMLIDGVLNPRTVLSTHGFDRFGPWERLPTWVSGLGAALVLTGLYGAWRRRSLSAPFVGLAVGGTLGYAALVDWLDFRITSFLVLPLAAMVGAGVSALASDLGRGELPRSEVDAIVQGDDDR